MSSRIWFLFQFFPMTAFVAVAKNGGFTGQAWEQAFLVGGVLAVIETLFLLWRRMTLDRLLLGANLYLLIGALSAKLGFHSIMRMYSDLQAAAIFIMIFLIGVGSTVFTVRGFVGVETKTPLDSKRASLALLAFTVICGLISFRYRGDTTLSGTLPVITLIIVKKVLDKRLDHGAGGGQS